MQNNNPSSTPIVMVKTLSKSQCPQEGHEKLNVPYAQVVGSLMYAMLCTRSDLAYPAGLVSRYQSNPGSAHWEAVKRIMKYIKGTKHLKLCFQAEKLEVIGYSDTDFGGDRDDCKSTSCHVFIFGGAVVSWDSKKQGCVVRHTQEAEYNACSMATTHAVWIRRFLMEFGLDLVNGPVEIFCDNQAAISLIHSGANSSKEKHVEIQYHYIRDIVEKCEIKVTYILTSDMVADPLTKGIHAEAYIKHVNLMGLRAI
ncbi:secreted RxLR effector protein 161-like [Telopea speciosissima]|uniref:secreted RxLR effector protein 161-like n=1 Tax=Telopea speciosissima TaxID=54955 RepID=UPI001CC5A887|nr:secreted RxLR effector protein 161-like [Telopea speciosissima]